MSTNGHTELTSGKSLFRIGEVSRLTDTKPFVLRYWETEFPMLQPVKSPKGHRLYRREDVETVRVIKHLLYDEGFTIAGARRHLNEAGGAEHEGSESSFGEVEAAESGAAESRSGELRTAAPVPNVFDVDDLAEDEFQDERVTTEIDESPTVVEAGAKPTPKETISPGLFGSDQVQPAPSPIDRAVLLELRDSLRAFLTLLESE
jgi:DNA-binding transcriptional MerR regulator